MSDGQEWRKSRLHAPSRRSGGYGGAMVELMRSWSQKRRVLFLIGLVVLSGILRQGAQVLTDEIAIRLIVDLVILVILSWWTITFFRVLLRDYEDHVKKNPKPW
jgi:hypothetical protein